GVPGRAPRVAPRQGGSGGGRRDHDGRDVRVVPRDAGRGGRPADGARARLGPVGMSHLHIPDGVLPWALWVPGWALALAGLLASAWGLRAATPREVGYRGSAGAPVLPARGL